MNQQFTYLDSTLEPLAPLLRDPSVVEVSLNPDGSVWVERQGDAHMRPVDLAEASPKWVRDLAKDIAGAARLTISDKTPILSAQLDYFGRSVRVQIVVAPGVEQGAALSMRFKSSANLSEIALSFLHGKEVSLSALRAEKIKELQNWVQDGMLQCAVKHIVQEKMNVVVSGGTSTGKTVLMRKLLHAVPQEERVITIEETPELYPEQPNAITLLGSRTHAPRAPSELLISSLRMRPDRIVVGEVRGSEALTFLEAINTGHGGSMTTLHAETPQLAMTRLAMAAASGDGPMRYVDLVPYIRQSIDVVIQVGRKDGQRGIAEFYIPSAEDNHAEL